MLLAIAIVQAVIMKGRFMYQWLKMFRQLTIRRIVMMNYFLIQICIISENIHFLQI